MRENEMDREDIRKAKNGAYQLLDRAETALEAGNIDEEGWYRIVADIITPAYLASDSPRAQSGMRGDDARWNHARSLIADAIHKDGTFLDVGCANGYLMECLERWARERGFSIEPHGLDIAPELAALARSRLPHWTDRIYVGNVMQWNPPQRYDFVRTGLEYVPLRRRRALIVRLLNNFVAPGGRLIIGCDKEEKPEYQIEPANVGLAASWGFPIAGCSERPHGRDDRFLYRVFWIEVPRD